MERKTIGIVILVFTLAKYSQANDFPSLLVANATMGISIKRLYSEWRLEYSKISRFYLI